MASEGFQMALADWGLENADVVSTYNEINEDSIYEAIAQALDRLYPLWRTAGGLGACACELFEMVSEEIRQEMSEDSDSNEIDGALMDELIHQHYEGAHMIALSAVQGRVLAEIDNSWAIYIDESLPDDEYEKEYTAHYNRLMEEFGSVTIFPE